MLRGTHDLCEIERLGQVRWLLVGCDNLADAPVDGLGATEQLRAWERELLVRAEGDDLLLRVQRRWLCLKLHLVCITLTLLLLIGHREAGLAGIFVRGEHAVGLL